MAHVDLLLLPPPSVYDFRQKAIMYGPISDMIPSSPVFEMYPLGFLTMASYLEARGLKVRIVNLALRMMNDVHFDVPHFLARMEPGAIGIDLHWLPHAHGAIEIAKLAKQAHPHTPVIFGGLSATYYHEELIQYPEVDYILRGDSTEPLLCSLLNSLSSHRSLEGIPNLTWKTDGQVRVNAQSFVSATADYVDLVPAQMMKMVMRYGDLQSVLPFNGWWQNPITAVFTAKGCAHECTTCGGSNQANTLLNRRPTPIFRSPQNLARNIMDICRFSKGPIFLVGDLYEAGEEYALATLQVLKGLKMKNEIIFEIFGMPSTRYLQAIDAAIDNWSLELSPESHDEHIRQMQDSNVLYRNAEMEEVIKVALSLRCHRIDVFFMIGLPMQNKQSVLSTIDYCEDLFKNSDTRLSCFISPMGPFLDPGSKCFEDPERFGYTLFARTLEEHRQLLVQPSWSQILNYETKWMSRDDLVEITYDAAEALNRLKLHYGRIDNARGHAVAKRIRQARALNNRLHQSASGSNPKDSEEPWILRGEIQDFSVSTVCDKRELFWRRHLVNFRWLEILRVARSFYCNTARNR